MTNDFKEMQVIFEVVSSENAYFEVGNRFKVKRIKSGAFAYGDRSAHTIDCDNATKTHCCFDTRYCCISTQKTIWRKYWKNYIEEAYGVKLKVIERG